MITLTIGQKVRTDDGRNGVIIDTHADYILVGFADGTTDKFDWRDLK